MSYYVTFRSLNATVRSIEAMGQISKECADEVIEIGQQMRIGKSWEQIKDEICVVKDPISQEFVGEYLIGQIEDDAATSDNRSKFDVLECGKCGAVFPDDTYTNTQGTCFSEVCQSKNNLDKVM